MSRRAIRPDGVSWRLRVVDVRPLEPSAIGGFSRVEGNEACHLRLSEVDEAALDATLGRIRRRYPAWRLEGGQAEGTCAQLDEHYLAAQRRRARG